MVPWMFDIILNIHLSFFILFNLCHSNVSTQFLKRMDIRQHLSRYHELFRTILFHSTLSPAYWECWHFWHVGRYGGCVSTLFSMVKKMIKKQCMHVLLNFLHIKTRSSTETTKQNSKSLKYRARNSTILKHKERHRNPLLMKTQRRESKDTPVLLTIRSPL